MEPVRTFNPVIPDRQRPPGRVTRVSQSLTRWALGSGLLALHATAFFLVTVVAMLWNLTSDPMGLWSIDLMRRWGALVVFHAVAVAAGSAAHRLLSIPQPLMVELPAEMNPPSTERSSPVIRAGRSGSRRS